jgi:hypothetical protein
LILEQIAKRRQTSSTPARRTGRGVASNWLRESRKDKVAYVGGGIAVVLVVVLLIVTPDVWRLALLLVLTGLGVLFGISTFFLFGLERTSSIRTYGAASKETGPAPKRRRRKNPAERCAGNTKSLGEQQDSEEARRKRKASYLATLRRAANFGRPRIRLGDSMPVWGTRGRGKRETGNSLADAMNGVFGMEGIRVGEPFGPLVGGGEAVFRSIQGLVEIDSIPYYVEVTRSKAPLDVQDVSSYLGRVFGYGHSGGILISTSGFTRSAVEICQEAILDRTVVLCELEEIVTVLKQNGSLWGLLKAKIVAAGRISKMTTLGGSRA